MPSLQEIAQNIQNNWQYYIAAIVIVAPICWKLTRLIEKNEYKITELTSKNKALEENNNILKEKNNNFLIIRKNQEKIFLYDIFLSCYSKLLTSNRFQKIFQELQTKIITANSANFNVFINKGPFPPNVDWSVYYFFINSVMSTCCALFVIIDDELINNNNCKQKFCFETDYDCAFFKDLDIYTFTKESKMLNDSVKRIRSLQLAQSNQDKAAKKITHYEFKDEVDLFVEIQNNILQILLKKGEITE